MTDMTDFELALERRLVAHAATVTRPASAPVIARAAIEAAGSPSRGSVLGGPWRPIVLVGLGVILLLSAVAGMAILGQHPTTIEGRFTVGPSVTAGRIANALVLPDGRVLVGVNSEETTIPGTSTLECEPPCRPHLQILDPQTGVFGATAPPPQGLGLESMALLHDGRVLVLGTGASETDPTATLYDPVADRFDQVGDPLLARTWPFLVTLADGRVLVGGGDTGTPLKTAELFDPATGTFSSTGEMTTRRSAGATATPLPDGRVLVLGGGPEVGTSAELFDPTTGTFRETGPMTVARGGFQSSTVLPDGRVLVVGGLVPDPDDPRATPDPTPTAEIFDPATGRFTAVGAMSGPRFMHAASVLADGTVLVAGGAHGLAPEVTPDFAADAEIFDPTSGIFRPTGDLLRARLWPAVVAVDGRVLILGSLEPTGDDPAVGRSTEWFD